MNTNIFKQVLAMFIGVFCITSYSFAELGVYSSNSMWNIWSGKCADLQTATGPNIIWICAEETQLDGVASTTIRVLINSSAGIEVVWADIYPPAHMKYLYTISGNNIFFFVYPLFICAGTYIITITAIDKEDMSSFDTDVFINITQQKNIYKGDIDGDEKIDLKDVIIVLRAIAGINTNDIRPSYALSGADVNEDNRVGIEEVVYILQKVSLLR